MLTDNTLFYLDLSEKHDHWFHNWKGLNHLNLMQPKGRGFQNHNSNVKQIVQFIIWLRTQWWNQNDADRSFQLLWRKNPFLHLSDPFLTRKDQQKRGSLTSYILDTHIQKGKPTKNYYRHDLELPWLPEPPFYIPPLLPLSLSHPCNSPSSPYSHTMIHRLTDLHSLIPIIWPPKTTRQQNLHSTPERSDPSGPMDSPWWPKQFCCGWTWAAICWKHWTWGHQVNHQVQIHWSLVNCVLLIPNRHIKVLFHKHKQQNWCMHWNKVRLG